MIKRRYRREQILETGVAIAVRHGLEEVNRAKIASELCVQLTTVVRIYQSHEDLLKDLALYAADTGIDISLGPLIEAGEAALRGLRGVESRRKARLSQVQKESEQSTDPSQT